MIVPRQAPGPKRSNFGAVVAFATQMPRLASLDLAGVAKFLGSAECRSVALLTGAGMSSGAGIPDFRSPGVAR